MCILYAVLCMKKKRNTENNIFFVFLMERLTPNSTRTDTIMHYPTLFRAPERPMTSDNTAQDARTAPETVAGKARQTKAEQVDAAFSDIRPMAGKLDEAVTKVQGWKKRGVIPEPR